MVAETSPAGDPFTCWFSECTKASLPLVGGKCASLGELINAGVRVPPGFAVTTAGYARFMNEGGIAKKVLTRLDGLDESNMEALDTVSDDIRQQIEETPFSFELEDLIAEHYRKLSMMCCVPAVPVAVRSSGTAEDMPDASFAGQQDTFLWIRGVEALLEHIRRCFSSLFTARAIAYRIKMGYAHDQVAISVGVQKMANSQTAGVMFTLNPANGDRSTIVINSSFGFGEAVVSGEVTPDEFSVNKISMEVLKRTISTKQVYYGIDLENQVSKLFDVPPERQKIQSLLEEEIIDLAAMGKTIEQHYGTPMDIEWTVDKDMPAGSNVFILQARPETVWSSKKAEPVSQGGGTALDHIVAAMMAGKKIT